MEKKSESQPKKSRDELMAVLRGIRFSSLNFSIAPEQILRKAKVVSDQLRQHGIDSSVIAENMTAIRGQYRQNDRRN